MASTDRQAQRDGLYPMRRADWMALSDEKLAAMAIATAQSGIKVLEAAGLDPGDSLRARASWRRRRGRRIHRARPLVAR